MVGVAAGLDQLGGIGAAAPVFAHAAGKVNSLADIVLRFMPL